MKTMLDQIVKTKELELANLSIPSEPTIVENKSLYHAIANRKTKIGILAEVKKASPSKGIICEVFNPVDIAKGYEKGGATALSVLTDETYFKGHVNYLTDIKKAVSLPVLRKDFIIAEKQILQSKRIGADAILLIASILEPNQLHEYYELAHELSLDVLVEVHDENELEMTLNKFTPRLIGVNNRDLKTFKTSLSVTKRLATHIPKGALLVSESGIFSNNDLTYVQNCGADAVLVGEALMKADSPEIGVKVLLGDKR